MLIHPGLQVEKLIVVEIRNFVPKRPRDSCEKFLPLAMKRVRGEDEKLHASAGMAPYLDDEPSASKFRHIIPIL